jgi:integrase
VSLTPHQVRVAEARWAAAGASDSVIGGRFRVLRAAIGWAYDERIIDHHPIRHMTGPTRPDPRRPLTDSEVAALLSTAEHHLLEALANDDGSDQARARRHRSEQDLLLARLAADAGARRGELATLQFADLDSRVLHIERAESGGTITTPKSGRSLTLTLGATTTRLWHTLAADWAQREAPAPLGQWLFSSDGAHHQRLTAGALGHRFSRLRDDARVPGAGLHRLRHNVATFLVARGDILRAQARLGHRDAATTLREYAYALPLTDTDAADALDDHLNRVPLPLQDDTPTRRRP